MLLSAGMGLAATLRGSVLAGMMVNESAILGKGPSEASCTLHLQVCILDTEFKVVLDDKTDYGSYWRR